MNIIQNIILSLFFKKHHILINRSAFDRITMLAHKLQYQHDKLSLYDKGIINENLEGIKQLKSVIDIIDVDLIVLRRTFQSILDKKD